MHGLRRFLLVSLLTALAPVAAAQPAAAQPDAAQPDAAGSKDAGKQYVQQGAEAYAESRYQVAAAAWERALELLGPERGWKLHYNLGLAYGELGDGTRAADHHGRFLERVVQETATLSESLEQRREDAAARLAAIKRDSGAMVLPPQTNGVTVQIDGQPARPVGFTAYLSPGEHKLVLWTRGATPRNLRVAVSAGQSVLIDTTLEPAPKAQPKPKPAPPATDSDHDGPSFPTVVVAVGAGLTAVSFLLPGLMSQRATDLANEAEALGQGHTGYAEKADEYDSARDAYRASYALPAGLGAITLGVAIYGIIHVSGDDSSEKAALRVGPGSLSIEGAF